MKNAPFFTLFFFYLSSCNKAVWVRGWTAFSLFDLLKMRRQIAEKKRHRSKDMKDISKILIIMIYF